MINFAGSAVPTPRVGNALGINTAYIYCIVYKEFKSNNKNKYIRIKCELNFQNIIDTLVRQAPVCNYV